MDTVNQVVVVVVRWDGARIFSKQIVLARVPVVSDKLVMFDSHYVKFEDVRLVPQEDDLGFPVDSMCLLQDDCRRIAIEDDYWEAFRGQLLSEVTMQYLDDGWEAVQSLTCWSVNGRHWGLATKLIEYDEILPGLDPV